MHALTDETVAADGHTGCVSVVARGVTDHAGREVVHPPARQRLQLVAVDTDEPTREMANIPVEEPLGVLGVDVGVFFRVEEGAAVEDDQVVAAHRRTRSLHAATCCSLFAPADATPSLVMNPLRIVMLHRKVGEQPREDARSRGPTPTPRTSGIAPEPLRDWHRTNTRHSETGSLVRGCRQGLSCRVPQWSSCPLEQGRKVSAAKVLNDPSIAATDRPETLRSWPARSGDDPGSRQGSSPRARRRYR